MIQLIPCVRVVKNPKHLSLPHYDFYSIYRLELLNEICALNESLKNFSKENLLKIFTLWSRRLHFPEEFYIFKIRNKVY